MVEGEDDKWSEASLVVIWGRVLEFGAAGVIVPVSGMTVSGISSKGRLKRREGSPKEGDKRGLSCCVTAWAAVGVGQRPGTAVRTLGFRNICGGGGEAEQGYKAADTAGEGVRGFRPEDLAWTEYYQNGWEVGREIGPGDGGEMGPEATRNPDRGVGLRCCGHPGLMDDRGPR